MTEQLTYLRYVQFLSIFQDEIKQNVVINRLTIVTLVKLLNNVVWYEWYVFTITNSNLMLGAWG